MADPIEKIVADALEAADLVFGESPVGLDFYLPDYKLHIEVKQFHSDRIAEQMSRAENVIAIQGREAAEWFANLVQTANHN